MRPDDIEQFVRILAAMGGCMLAGVALGIGIGKAIWGF